MNQTKIDWCDATVNLVDGCTNNCKTKYGFDCYAEAQNTRYKFVDNWHHPKAFPARLKAFNAKKPKSIFVNSMSDIGNWKQEWFNTLAAAINKNPQHKYIALTKCPDKLREKLYQLLIVNSYKMPFVELHMGFTVCTNNDLLNKNWNLQAFNFLSIEPILEPIYLPFEGLETIRQIIIGAETGRRTDKVIPEKRWITNLTAQADARGMRVFMKESLRELMGADFRQDRLIWEK